MLLIKARSGIMKVAADKNLELFMRVRDHMFLKI